MSPAWMEPPVLLREYRGHKDSAISVALARDGRGAASASGEGEIRLWDPVAGTERWSRKLDAWWPRLLADPAGTVLAVGSQARVILLDWATGREIRTSPPLEDVITAMTFTPDGRTLLVKCDKGVTVWGIAPVGEFRILEENLSSFGFAPDYDPKPLAASPDGAWVVAGTIQHSLAIFNLETGLQAADGIGQPRLICPRSAETDAVVFAPDGQHLFTSGVEGLVCWSFPEGKLVRELGGDGRRGRALAMSPEGSGLVSLTVGGPAALLNARTGRELHLLDSAVAVSVSGDGRFLALAGDDAVVRIYQFPT